MDPLYIILAKMLIKIDKKAIRLIRHSFKGHKVIYRANPCPVFPFFLRHLFKGEGPLVLSQTPGF